MTPTLFVSHSGDDAATARRIVDHLERSGLTCWIAPRDIPPGAVYADAITEGVQSSRALAVVLSGSANASDGVKREVELASRCGRPLIPIRVDGCAPAQSLAYYLNNVQWIDYWRDGDAALDTLIVVMQGSLPRKAIADRANNSRRPAALAMGAVVALALAATGFYLLPGTPSLGTRSGASSESADSPSSISTASTSHAPATSQVPVQAPTVTQVEPGAFQSGTLSIRAQRSTLKRAIAAGTPNYLVTAEVALHLQNNGTRPIKVIAIDPRETFNLMLDNGTTLKPWGWQTLGMGACLGQPLTCKDRRADQYLEIGPGSFALVNLNIGRDRAIEVAEAVSVDRVNTGDLIGRLHVIEEDKERVVQFALTKMPIRVLSP
jgi:hypothetical protein